jgi:hypothetical protein
MINIQAVLARYVKVRLCEGSFFVKNMLHKTNLF